MSRPGRVDVRGGVAAREDGPMPKIMGWVPFSIFVVLALLGSLVGILEFNR